MPDANGNTTWSDVIDSIGQRLSRPSLPPQFITLLAQEQADELAAEGYWFQEDTDTTITTQNGESFYNLPAGTIKVTFCRFQLGNVMIPIYPARSYADLIISDPVVPSVTAIPSVMRNFGRAIRLFPTPNAQYPLELTLTRRAEIPGMNDMQNTTSIWVNEGRKLIVASVCKNLAMQLTRDPDRAAIFERAETEAKDALEITTFARKGPHYVKKHL